MRTRRVIGFVLVACCLCLPVAARADAAPKRYFPGQFIAKLYTEALGRLPDQNAWTSLQSRFNQSGCQRSTLRAVATSIYTSTEFTALDYDNAGKLLTLYRGVLNREPDQDGFDNWLTRLGKGTSWPTVVGGLLSGDEFSDLVPKICSGATDSADTSYDLGTTPPLSVFTTGPGFTGSGRELQIRLNDTKPGGTVALAQRAVIPLTTALTVPPRVTLTTTGGPNTAHYANMGRLVRASPFNREMVTLANGASLRNVWLDGERDTPDNWAASRSNLRLNGGTGTTATEDKISNTAGPSSVFVLGDFDNYPCKNLAVTNNLITAYSSNNYDQDTWTDGISVTCGSTNVTGNQIVDTSDVGIVLYRASGTEHPVQQASQVHRNVILSAGNSMYGGIGADPLYVSSGQHIQTHDFTGSDISGNTIWTSPNTHFDIGLAAGTRPWFGRNTNTGVGASFTGNTTGRAGARVETGIAVSAMDKATVSDNAMSWLHPRGIGRCPNADIAVENGTATGQFEPHPDYTHNFDRCIGHLAKPKPTLGLNALGRPSA